MYQRSVAAGGTRQAYGEVVGAVCGTPRRDKNLTRASPEIQLLGLYVLLEISLLRGLVSKQTQFNPHCIFAGASARCVEAFVLAAHVGQRDRHTSHW